jgi:hypothetical protein
MWLIVGSQTRIVTNVTRLTTRVHIDLARNALWKTMLFPTVREKNNDLLFGTL